MMEYLKKEEEEKKEEEMKFFFPPSRVPEAHKDDRNKARAD